MKVLELYSGIGGMHLALEESGVSGQVIASIDINTVANLVYKHNFPETLLLNKNIQSLQAEDINTLDVDTILMSPPCQPFTRNGLKGDVNDARTCSFLHILDILPNLNVNKILMENVKGFETSEMRNMFVESLEKCGFVYQEFILSPTQFAVPNTRHRYYCLAKKLPDTFKFAQGPLMENLPKMYEQQEDVFPLSKIVVEEDLITDFKVPDNTLLKRVQLFDITFRDSKRSCCFTKAYKRYAEGTGSVYTNLTEEEFQKAFKLCEESDINSPSYLENLRNLNLRYFTPKEVCRLMSFPESFTFPKNITSKQMYMLLGNSINVKVVSRLIKILND